MVRLEYESCGIGLDMVLCLVTMDGPSLPFSKFSDADASMLRGNPDATTEETETVSEGR